MLFVEDLERHGEALLRLVDAGVGVAAACGSLEITRGRGYEMLRALGRGRGRKTVITEELRGQVVAVFGRSGSINRAAIAGGLSHDAARRILVAAGLVGAAKAGYGKARAKARFAELVEAGWSITRAAGEVGVNVRTGRDWRRGVRKVGNTRVRPDGMVVDYGTGTRYFISMTRPADAVISDRYLSLDDRLAIADGLVNKHTLTAIAAGIGKHKSTICREIRAHSVEGIYLPHQAHRDAASARARPKTSKLAVDPVLRERVEQGLETKLSPEQISHRLVKDFPDDESMRVSHETIYQALYFQARGGLKREVQTALRTGLSMTTPSGPAVML
ncbi:IS30 family transposase [Kribbella qitaiheensis]|uniref:IS30 family transposase n=1 Tax=Kribbella qitaiheensis TaxID=1544730 RepID=A0A7G6WVC8_9ACTN|nr:helix-turn-helix domain-containing protein [Kribbella qitaiheensis]QNE17943.1 IS30 family transposase [Kribbella qitaiheensis]